MYLPFIHKKDIYIVQASSILTILFLYCQRAMLIFMKKKFTEENSIPNFESYILAIPWQKMITGICKKPASIFEKPLMRINTSNFIGWKSPEGMFIHTLGVCGRRWQNLWEAQGHRIRPGRGPAQGGETLLLPWSLRGWCGAGCSLECLGIASVSWRETDPYKVIFFLLIVIS